MMRLLILAIFASLTCIQASAQELLSLSTGDTVYSNKQSPILVGTTYLSTSSNKPIQVHWKLKRTDLPDSWTLYSVCDNVLCYLPPIPGESDMDTFSNYSTSKENKLEVTVRTNGDYDSTGIVEFEVSVPDSGFTKTVTYVYNSWKLKVSDVWPEYFDLKTRSNQVVISNPNQRNVELTVLGLTGKIVYSKKQRKDFKHQFPQGVYILRLRDLDSNETYTRKVVLQEDN